MKMGMDVRRACYEAAHDLERFATTIARGHHLRHRPAVRALLPDLGADAPHLLRVDRRMPRPETRTAALFRP
jgi:hypothetical protein